MGLSGLRQGTDYLKATASKSKFTPFISWKDGESKTIAFTTPIEGVAKVRMHDFVKVPADNERGFRYDHFMCRKDPAWLDESGGECYLCDVVGHKPSEKHSAVGVELEPLHGAGGPAVTGLNVVTRSFTREDGTEATYAQWGLVRQSFGNFYNYFTAFGQKWGGINHTAFDIQRMGADKNTTYVIMPLGGVELPDFDALKEPVPVLHEVLESMGSKEKYATLQGAEQLDQSRDFGEDTYASQDTTGDAIKTKFEALKDSLPDQLKDKVESFSGA